MQTPPPYYAGAPKKSNTGIIVAIVVGILALCCGGAFFLGYTGFKAVKGMTGFVGCGLSLDQTRNAMVAYAKAHKDTLPPKESWQDDIKPYIQPLPQNTGPMEIAPSDSGVCDMKANSGITYNADLAGKKLSSIKDPYTTILVWEVPTVSRNQSASYKEPAPGSGPVLLASAKRGWVLQPVQGSGYFIDENGSRSSVPTRSDFKDNGHGGIHIDTEPSSKPGKIEVHTTSG